MTPQGALVAITSVPDDGARRTPKQIVTGAGHAVASWYRERKRRSAAKGRKKGFNRGLVALFLVLLGVFFLLVSQVFSAPTPGEKITLDKLSVLAANHQVSSAT